MSETNTAERKTVVVITAVYLAILTGSFLMAKNTKGIMYVFFVAVTVILFFNLFFAIIPSLLKAFRS